MSSSNCCFLIFIQISQEASQVVWYSHLLEFSTVYCNPHSQRLGIVNKAEIDAFLELSCFSHDPAPVGNLISGSSAFSKTSLNIRRFTVHILQIRSYFLFSAEILSMPCALSHCLHGLFQCRPLLFSSFFLRKLLIIW